MMIGAIAGQLVAQSNLSGGVMVLSPGGGVLVLGWEDPSCGRQAQAAHNADKRFPYWGYACDPLYAGNNGVGYPALSVTVAIPQVLAPPPPAPIVRPEVREYHWPSSGSDSNATTFSIVSRDGRVESASMVWVQDNAVCFVTPDGDQGRIPLDSIDRKATRQRNAEKQTELLVARRSQRQESSTVSWEGEVGRREAIEARGLR